MTFCSVRPSSSSSSIPDCPEKGVARDFFGGPLTVGGPEDDFEGGPRTLPEEGGPLMVGGSTGPAVGESEGPAAGGPDGPACMEAAARV